MNYKNMKILLVEDSAVTRGMEIDALKEIGYSNIIGAGDGKEAVGILSKEENIDLIISDWNMPNLSGYELLAWVRSNENLRKTPFIMATAHGERRQAARAVEAGAAGFITFTKDFIAALADARPNCLRHFAISC